MEHPENDKRYKGLQVNNGVASQPITNPYRTSRRARTRELSVNDYVEGILKGDMTVLGRAVTLVESTADRHQAIAQEVIEKCLPYSGNSRRIGITGVPGAGKSTSIDVFGLHVLRQGHKLAVLAIDPSSERTKGSILGDKTRMEKLSQQQDAFIRPSPSAGSLGGVARKTRETIVLCEAAGYDTVFIETVGVGQSETAVHSMVDFFLLIQLAGTGDELQGIKRGIMEMADGIVINKCDGDNVDRAKLAASQFRNALFLFPPSPSKWKPEVLTYSGYYELGIDAVWDMIDRYFEYVKKTGYFERKRHEQAKYWMMETIDEQLRNHFYSIPEVRALLEQKEMRVLNNEQSSFTAAKEVLDFYFSR
ncbi:MAG: methylmalonyl Co-A mutase-associated GTPase MeaB [Muribaculaceae bacterium]|nr:methylmalonyl Co-A mutase-associated GTPase MeaB [Muribaculaceae bacterium]MDE6533863.1 methylmalonyl Co-A mutase-associated GTPase MeaB [Muribaculaceae bacterium]MDE6772271.1 methylmalonyl Co-A mutase-associated GTPase MeaB [Muribaculaceae bacterium]